MGIRDDELSRMIKYAEALDIKVSFRQHKPDLPGALWELDDTDNSVKIILYTWPNQSKTTLILNFLHELAHHKSWIAQGRELNKTTLDATSIPDELLTEHQRYIVYKFEAKDAKYRYEIANELDIKITKKKLDKDIRLDKWIYYKWWKTGSFPTQKELDKKKKQLRRQYKC